ncbi:GntR family transcriptional regulator [Aureibacillus halotolerans]|uniref:GntR family transcriptional regulator n=1 Tax=Aureibacillus halotolerans TaxID=1508390 RepID=A0A4R6TW75_9BACI|nr:GntR family transcriptional regulator [Aureibacillus halotolerans]TDQ36259.1 GntR family transcriptional regulator [Aureibacillus halotolerans]
MFLNIDLNSDVAIYTQMKQQIIEGIARKELAPGAPLPSVRSLASDLGINLHTVNKAYQQLKQEGFILIHRQKGVVVHPEGVTPADSVYKELLHEQLRPLMAEAICRQMTEDDIQQLVRLTYNTIHSAGEE